MKRAPNSSAKGAVRRGHWSTKLPPKEHLPKRGSLHWCSCYFAEGDWIEWMGHDGIPQRAKATKVRRNNYGRVSYYAGEQLILTEDIARRYKLSSTR